MLSSIKKINKDYFLYKIIWDFIRGKIKIKNIKKITKVQKIMGSINQNNLASVLKLRKISFDEMTLCVEFHNKYTRNEKISLKLVYDMVNSGLQKTNELNNNSILATVISNSKLNPEKRRRIKDSVHKLAFLTKRLKEYYRNRKNKND